jgi:hypothetical protein
MDSHTLELVGANFATTPFDLKGHAFSRAVSEVDLKGNGFRGAHEVDLKGHAFRRAEPSAIVSGALAPDVLQPNPFSNWSEA